MIDHRYSGASLNLLAQCHPMLRQWAWLLLAHSPYDLKVLPSTIRTPEQQRVLVDTGKSRTMDSRHLQRPSLAVDLGIYEYGKVTWDPTTYQILGDIGESLIKRMALPIEWGGRFPNFFDGPHWQLTHKDYPNA